MSANGLFLTGGTGFIGRQLATGLVARGDRRVVSLSRRLPGAQVSCPGVEEVVGDLREPATYAKSLAGVDLVIHLAASTGKAARADYFSINVDGTRALVDASHRAGVRRFIFVSSIAATYADKTAYHYAQSKEQAEQVVRDSRLNYLIVRPTMVLGAGSPIWNRLLALAGAPVIPVFGDGRVRVQPVDVDDVASFMLLMAARPTLPDCAVDLGGPDVMTFEDLLRTIGRVLRGRDRPVVHLPVKSAILLLSWLERWLPPLLPITAGQLSAFINDSVAQPSRLTTEQMPRMTSVDEMLKRLIVHG